MDKKTLEQIKKLTTDYYNLLYPKQYSDSDYRMFLYNYVEKMMELINPEVKKPNRNLSFLYDY